MIDIMTWVFRGLVVAQISLIVFQFYSLYCMTIYFNCDYNGSYRKVFAYIPRRIEGEWVWLKSYYISRKESKPWIYTVNRITREHYLVEYIKAPPKEQYSGGYNG